MPLSAASRKRLDRTAIYAVSVAAHVAFLVILGIRTPEVRNALINEEAPPVDVFIMPPPPRETPARQVREPSPPPSPIRPRQAVIRPEDPFPMPPLPIAPVPSPKPPPPAAGPPAAAGSGGTGSGLDPWKVAPGGDLRDALRRSSAGCANETAVGLNRREREVCAERLGKGAADAPYIPPAIGRAKQDRFDATAASKEIARRRKEAPPPVGTSPGDNAGGTRTDGIGMRGYDD